MPKKSQIIMITILALAMTGCLGYIMGQNSIKKTISEGQAVSGKTDVYSILSKKCNGDSCCLASVNNMREGNFSLAENNSCPIGFTKNLLKCESSYSWCEPQKTAEFPPISNEVACTQEARQCPDGSFVSRIGPNCEFAACAVASNPVKSNEIDYYSELANECKGDSCCLSSVNTMRQRNFSLTKNNTCSIGYTKNMLKCENSLSWCEPQNSANLPPVDKGAVCAQDAKQCPDGSYVTRTGPNCAFSDCGFDRK